MPTVPVTAGEVNEANKVAKTVFPVWLTTPSGKELIFKFKAILDNYLEELTLLLAEELGKNLEEAGGDTLKAIEVIKQSLTKPSRVYHWGV
ncbi:Methylmalonate-semialdehyde dehydrogenase (acylating) [Pelotomaculum schinkii]|uniref:Methylmalonate-semialdehyde dehydrogenase (Acylating) n=1 Tax=Pelotomaculum schinkii TaxID=78350 RepID=A0A4Y7R8Q3_9FIRM|nr:aldehyde dehydrogenase family protein [Pelotomaculum schinkii]TEB05031.1 Methylmalonate-semialdehyde dehydrogenase (acylating) [Pelotomaculum schinkii]